MFLEPHLQRGGDRDAPRRVELMLDGAERKTRDVAEALDLPTTTARRTLEDLNAHRLVTRDRFGDSESSAAKWQVTEWTREQHARAFETVPETRDSPI